MACPGLKRWKAWSRHFSGEAGVGLVEVLVGLAVLSMTSVPVASLLQSSMASVAASQDRILAAQLLSEAIQQAQALPYADVVKGLNPGELTAGGDPLIAASGGGSWVYVPTGAPIVADSQATYEPPLVPYRHEVFEDGTTFTVAVYPTLDGTGSDGPEQMTSLAVWVYWNGGPGSREDVTASTTLYSPGSVASAGTAAPSGGASAPAPGGSPGPAPPSPGGVENDCGQHQESLLASPSATAVPGGQVSIYYLDDTEFSTAEVLIDSVADASIAVSASNVSPGSVELNAVDTCGGSPPNPDQPEGYQLSGGSSGSGSLPTSGPAPGLGGRPGYEEELSFGIPSDLASGSTVTIRAHDGDGDYDAYTWTVTSSSGSSSSGGS